MYNTSAHISKTFAKDDTDAVYREFLHRSERIKSSLRSLSPRFCRGMLLSFGGRNPAMIFLQRLNCDSDDALVTI